MFRRVCLVLLPGLIWSAAAVAVHATPQDRPDVAVSEAAVGDAASQLDVRELIRAGGAVGYVIVLLSLTMVALIVEHVLSLRRKTVMPPGLAEEVHRLIAEQRYQQAEQACRLNPSYLARVLIAGLREIGLGYATIEKAMEDAAAEQSARLFRKLEYLSVIGTIAPMLGLLGTVWGMILAFVEFESQTNPQVAELAPGIYKALITTLLGLGVAVPSLAAFAIFRNRIDELVAEASLIAEHVFADYKRAVLRPGRATDSGGRKSRGARAEAPSTRPEVGG